MISVAILWLGHVEIPRKYLCITWGVAITYILTFFEHFREDGARGTCYEGDCPGAKVYSTDGTRGPQFRYRLCAGRWGDYCNLSRKHGTGESFYGRCLYVGKMHTASPLFQVFHHGYCEKTRLMALVVAQNQWLEMWCVDIAVMRVDLADQNVRIVGLDGEF